MKERKTSSITNPYPAKRDVFKIIADFIEGEECLQGKVLVLYGLRRTGKTTLMEQYIAESPYKDKCAFYVVGNGDTLDDVFDAITKESEENGKTIFFFDEITRAADFAIDSSYLADIYAKEGIRIILTGTDSLGFYFAESGELAFRVENVKTSHISFAEHCRIFGEKDIDDYIRFGGLMKQGADKAYVTSYEEACKYLDESVSENIVNSLEKVHYQSALKRLDHDEMKIVIEKLVELYNGEFNRQVMKNELKSVTATYPVKKLDGLVDRTLVKKMIKQKKDMAREFVKKINADGVIKTEIDESMVFWLEHYLREIGVLSVTAREYFVKDENGVWNFAPKEYEYYIIQPAIKYYHLKEALKFVEDSSFYKELSPDVKNFAKVKLEEQIFGRMTEEIVLFDTRECLSRDIFDVCKPYFEINSESGKYPAEYDMLVCNKNTHEYYAFEIKHSSEAVKDQCKHLLNPEVKEAVDFQFGNRKGVSVLYRGNPFVTTDGICYLNLADFMITLDQYKDIKSTMEFLMKDLLVRDLPEETETQTIESMPTFE